MEVTAGTEGNRPLLKLVTTAQSRPAITKFFPVDNRVESMVDLKTLLPEYLTFRRREKGKRRKTLSCSLCTQMKRGTVTRSQGRGSTETFPLLRYTPTTPFRVSTMPAAQSYGPTPGSSL